MLKKVLPVALAIGFMALGACSEKGPAIDFGGGAQAAVDTTYLVTPPTPQPRVVLVEEFTGAKCSNCPDARALLGNISNQNPGRVATMGIHIFNFVQSEPVEHSKYDFRTDAGTSISKDVFGSVPAMPMAGIDRMKNAKNERLMGKNEWSAFITNRLATEVGVNLDVTSSYAAGENKATMRIKATYPKAATGTHMLSIAVIEDNLYDKQDSVGSVLENYRFMHTLRGYLTPVGGIPMGTSAPKEAGRVIERSYTFDLNPSWVAENCHVVVFVHKNEGDEKEILQVAEVHLKN